MQTRSMHAPAAPRGHRPHRLRLALLAAAVLGSALAVATPAAAPGPVVRVGQGLVQGSSKDGVDTFLGMPYAAPPLRDLRWRPPQAALAWKGVRQATRFGNTCPQDAPGIFATPSDTEDCLYLNVFAPSARGHRGKLPVMVWFYGGGLISGESNDYDGSKLAAAGTVVVSMNFRVGALGFFSHPAIDGEGHAAINYGIMDQQFALQWVRRNIAAFGGDPDNVTIFGQSGGATSVIAQLVSPTAAGLFKRAIVESGTHISATDADTARQEGEDFAAATGCGDQSAACLRRLSVAQILAHQGAITASQAADFPTLDGNVLVRTPIQAFGSGQFNRVPILTGLTRDEQAFFLPEATGGAPLTAEGYASYAKTIGGAHVEAILARYPVSAYPSPSLAEIAAAEGYKVCTARLLDRLWTRYVPVYAYQFNDRSAPSYFPKLSYPMRAYHTAELQYLFPLFHGGQGTPHPLDAAQQRLADDLVAEWTGFARRGTPATPWRPGFDWRPYAPALDNVESLDLPGPSMSYGYGRTYDCAFWDTVLSYR